MILLLDYSLVHWRNPAVETATNDVDRPESACGSPAGVVVCCLILKEICSFVQRHCTKLKFSYTISTWHPAIPSTTGVGWRDSPLLSPAISRLNRLLKPVFPTQTIRCTSAMAIGFENIAVSTGLPSFPFQTDLNSYSGICGHEIEMTCRKAYSLTRRH